MDIKLLYNYKRLRPSLNSLSNLVMDLLFHPSRVFHLYANFQPIDIDRHISIAPLLPERNTERYIIPCKWLAVRTMDPAPKTENWFRKPQLMLSDLDTFFRVKFGVVTKWRKWSVALEIISCQGEWLQKSFGVGLNYYSIDWYH